MPDNRYLSLRPVSKATWLLKRRALPDGLRATRVIGMSLRSTYQITKQLQAVGGEADIPIEHFVKRLLPSTEVLHRGLISMDVLLNRRQITDPMFANENKKSFRFRLSKEKITKT